MISFAHPWLLALLVLPIALFLRGWRRHGAGVVVPYDHAPARPRKFLWFLLRLVSSLPVLILAVVILLLAGPLRFSEPRARRIMTNIEFLVDVSGSMTSPYGDGNRYDGAMDSIMKFIDARNGDSFGLTVFGTDVLHWVPLTSDPSVLKCAPEFLSPLKLPNWFGGGTMIGMGLESSLTALEARADGDRMIILLTDGYSFDLANGNDEIIARKLKNANITVYCIHIDNSAPPDEVQLIASMTGGKTFSAGDPGTLGAVFATIDTMKKARMEQMSGESLDDFRPWALAGGGLVLASLLASFGFRFTPW
ncbi:MAG: von Willebrand factor type [Verrucomicrobiales bacterium]|nr:von Willebrand factor type [Verrucomicrobiales bacterium]